MAVAVPTAVFGYVLKLRHDGVSACVLYIQAGDGETTDGAGGLPSPDCVVRILTVGASLSAVYQTAIWTKH